jgi:hypothetical protein
VNDEGVVDEQSFAVMVAALEEFGGEVEQKNQDGKPVTRTKLAIPVLPVSLLLLTFFLFCCHANHLHSVFGFLCIWFMQISNFVFGLAWL